MNVQFMGPGLFGNRLGQPTQIMVQAGGFRAFGTYGSFAAPPNGPMMPEPWQKEKESLGRGGGGGGRGGGGRGWGGPHRSFNVVNNVNENEGVICGPGETGPWCEPEQQYLMGQSRTQGVEYDVSAETLCSMLKKALAVSKKEVTSPEWKDFLDALDRLRPLNMSTPEWRSKIYHQMALTCPDEVSILRSMRGAERFADRCVMLGVKPGNSFTGFMTEPYTSRGWTIQRVTVNEPPPQPSDKLKPIFERQRMFEIWACPPGQAIPKKTSLTPQEATDLAHSLSQAIQPLRAAGPDAASCVKDSQADLAVMERLLDRLNTIGTDKNGPNVDVTQDEVDAAKKIIDCASQLGAQVAPGPATVEAAASGGGISPLATAGMIGGAGALAALFLI